MPNVGLVGWECMAAGRRARRDAGPSVPELEQYAFVLLRRPEHAPELTEAEGDALQQAHLDYLQSLRDQGVLTASGPFDDQPDESWRGLCLLRATPEQARELLAADPLVRRGRLEPVVLTWQARKGDIASG